MPLVVVDTSISLPATLSEPGGLMRKFMVLLALGSLAYREEHLNLELDALQQEAAVYGGEILGAASLEAMRESAGNRRAALVELLPYGIPEDWVAVGSPALFDEYLRKVLEKGPVLRSNFSTSEAPALLARLQSLCVHAAPPFDPTVIPAFTSDPKDDPVIYSALLAKADFVISDDKHIVPKDQRPVAFYEHGDARVAAMTFDHLMTDHLSDVNWDEIDGAWLRNAFGH